MGLRLHATRSGFKEVGERRWWPSFEGWWLWINQLLILSGLTLDVRYPATALNFEVCPGPPLSLELSFYHAVLSRAKIAPKVLRALHYRGRRCTSKKVPTPRIQKLQIPNAAKRLNATEYEQQGSTLAARDSADLGLCWCATRSGFKEEGERRWWPSFEG